MTISETRDLPGWEHIISADDAGVTIENISLSADETTLENLAALLNVVKVENLHADLKLSRIQGGLVVRIDGKFHANILQDCVVTLEPLNSDVSEEFTAWYSDPEQAVSFNKARQQREMQKQHGEAPIVDESDDPEAIIDGKIDLGDVVTQFLSLAIDPYAHKEGVQFEVGDDEPRPETSPVRKNPFAALKDWKDKQGS